jgi:anti-sigma factor RsiW
MTPQLARQLEVATSAHLTEDQFGELLAGDAQQPIPAPVQAHLLACQKCAAELAGLRESLSFFQQATGAYADNELRHLPQASLPDRPMRSPVLAAGLEPAYWLAAAVLLAGFLPMQSAHRNALPPAPVAASSDTGEIESQSDEALLNDVDSELSASVPASMQALVDPSTDDTDISAQTSTQRKD